MMTRLVIVKHGIGKRCVVLFEQKSKLNFLAHVMYVLKFKLIRPSEKKIKK